jgi:hypothetical protein
MIGEGPSEVEGREAALDDAVLDSDDMALDDVALDDVALDNAVLDDAALNDTVLDDAVLDDGVARLPSTDPPNCRVLPSPSKWTWISGEGAEWLERARLGW